MTGPIYLDNNATTPLSATAWEAMRPCLLEAHGNPASAHSLGRQARRALEDAREKVASLLGAFPDEVVFTSGATEANNLALFGLAGERPAHLLSSPVEHPSVLEPLRHLCRAGFTLDFFPVDAAGKVDPSSLPPLLRPDTRLTAVMLANHETGTLQPVAQLAALLPQNIPLHCDAVQAVGKVPVSFHALGASTLSLSAHKFHGPRGIGALLVRRGVRVRPLLFGGHQQHGLRPGTEPVALAVGLAAALDEAITQMEARHAHVLALRRRFLASLRQSSDPVLLNGPEEGGLPHTVNLSFPGLKADALLMALDLAGVACATGSACSSGSLLPSPVLQAMRVPDAVLRSALRFSFSALSTTEEVDEAALRICKVIKRLRQTSSPLA